MGEEGWRRLLVEGVLVRDPQAHGVTRSAIRWAVRSGRLRRVGPCAVVEATAWEAADDRERHVMLLRAVTARHDGLVVAGPSAAALWGLPLPGPPPAAPVVLRPRTRERPQRGGGRTGRLDRRAWLAEHEVTRVRGLPVTTAPRTFVDAARGLALPWALALGDAALRAGSTRQQLLAAATRTARAPGSRTARQAAALADGSVESPLESLARGTQVALGLPVPRVQVWVGDRRPEYRVDMLVEQFATAVEADGRLKYEGATARPGQLWRDKRRMDRLLELGIDTHSFVAADQHHPVRWGRALVRTFIRSCRRSGLPEPRLDLPWW